MRLKALEGLRQTWWPSRRPLRLLPRRWAVILATFLAGPLSAQSVDHRFNGMWYQPELAGHGFNLVVEVGEARRTVFLTFFTYDDQGRANFYAGNVEVADWPLGQPLQVPLHQTAGSPFSEPRSLDFSDPGEFAPAGTLTIRLFGCGHGDVAYVLDERTSAVPVTHDFRIEKLIGAPQAECRQTLPRGALEKVARIDALDLDDYRYYLYVPEDYPPAQPLPLLIAWHGAAGPGQAANQARLLRDLWQTIAEDMGFIVLAQVGTSPNGSWIPGNAVRVLNRLLADLQSDYALDPARIYGWGFSAGGHTLHAVALANTHFFAGYAVNAGVLEAVAGREALAEVARRVPVSSLVGAADPLIDLARGDRDAFESNGWREGLDLYFRVFDGGHEVRAEHLAEHWDHLQSHSLDRR